MLKSLFTEHPASVGETYSEHMGMALGFAGRMLLGSLACLVHGVLPFVCARTGSKTITELHRRMVTQRDRRVMDSDDAAVSGFAQHTLR